MKKVALHIDEYACWGCKTCEVACKQEHRQPDGINYVCVTEDGPKSVNGKLDVIYRLNVCQHCDTPLCAGVCLEEAIVKREDGIVVLDSERCTGCQVCVEACPFGVITFNRVKGTAQKCNLCSHRVDQGLYPACADNVCLAHCIYFGDPAEIEKKVLENRKGRADQEK